MQGLAHEDTNYKYKENEEDVPTINCNLPSSELIINDKVIVPAQSQFAWSNEAFKSKLEEEEVKLGSISSVVD